MAQVINTNIASLNAQRNLNSSQASLATSIQRLSSGLRVNSAKDDAAGLAIANRMDGQTRGMNIAVRNANDGISLAQTAEGSLGKITDMLQRMRELAVQAANDTNGTSDRASLDQEFSQLKAEIDRTFDATKFNGTQILGAAATLNFQIGANNVAEDKLAIVTSDLSAGAGITAAAAGDITSLANAQAAITNIDTALTEINGARATFGAVQNRFESVISNLQVASENTAAARSRIMDADFATETAALTRSQILQQAGTAMLAQANQVPQQVLSLLPR
ncbi:MAG: flagellin [Burkholderiales bacterium]|jgi:flagellin